MRRQTPVNRATGKCAADGTRNRTQRAMANDGVADKRAANAARYQAGRAT